MHKWKQTYICSLWTTVCTSKPRITQKREKIIPYFHCGPWQMMAREAWLLHCVVSISCYINVNICFQRNFKFTISSYVSLDRCLKSLKKSLEFSFERAVWTLIFELLLFSKVNLLCGGRPAIQFDNALMPHVFQFQIYAASFAILTCYFFMHW